MRLHVPCDKIGSLSSVLLLLSSFCIVAKADQGRWEGLSSLSNLFPVGSFCGDLVFFEFVCELCWK